MADKGKIKLGVSIDEQEAEKVSKLFRELAADVKALEEAQATVASPGPAAATPSVAFANPEKIAAAKKAIAEQAQGQWNVSAAVKDSVEQYEFEDQKLNELLQTARRLGKDEQVYAILHKKGYVEGINEIQKMLGLKEEDIAITKEQIKAMQRHATILRHESIALRRGAADLQLVSQAAIVSGTALIGGTLLIAKQYTDAVGTATKASRDFLVANSQLAAAKNRIGEVFAKEAVPFIREATAILTKAGQFIREHPQIVGVAIKGAEILIAAGLLGKAIATGARLTADALAIHSSVLRLLATRAEEALAAEKQLAAAELQNAAADKQLAAGQGSIAGGVASKGGLVGFLSTKAGIAGLILGIGLVSVKTADKLSELQDIITSLAEKSGKAGPLIMQGWKVFEQMVVVLNPLAIGIKNVKDAFERDVPLIVKQLQNLLGVVEEGHRRRTQPTRASAEDAIPLVKFSEQFEAVLSAYEDYKFDDLEMVRKHYEERKDIVNKGLAAEKKENEDFARDLANIQKHGFRAVAKAQRDFDRQIAEDDRDYARDREKILREAGDEALQIEQDLQEKLRKLEEEHAVRRTELLQARDAVGLVKENARFAREQAEAVREANAEIAQRRQDIAERLRILAEEFAIERAQRLEDFEIRMAEIRQDIADRLEERRKAHIEEINDIRANTREKLREEQAAYIEERKRRYVAFLDQIRNLDAALLGEKKLRLQRYKEMEADLDAFLAKYRAGLKTLTLTATVTGKAEGGYASYGLYRLGDTKSGAPGGHEFVMSAAATRAAERIIGGGLTQDRLLSAMISGGGGNRTINLTDQRRFDSRLSVADRRAIMEDTRQMIAELVNA